MDSFWWDFQLLSFYCIVFNCFSCAAKYLEKPFLLRLLFNFYLFNLTTLGVLEKSGKPSNVSVFPNKYHSTLLGKKFSFKTSWPQDFRLRRFCRFFLFEVLFESSKILEKLIEEKTTSFPTKFNDLSKFNLAAPKPSFRPTFPTLREQVSQSKWQLQFENENRREGRRDDEGGFTGFSSKNVKNVGVHHETL